MIRFILKLWSNNDTFAEAARLVAEKKFDGVELYNNVKEPLDWTALETLKAANVVGIHNPHSHGWHEFFLNEEQLLHWEQSVKVADFFGADHIVVHPAKTHSVESFLNNLKRIADPRIIIENMAGRDITNEPMGCGQTLADLRAIAKEYPICFDMEKAVKAAAHQGIEYKEFIRTGLQDLAPTYFHISGGSVTDPVDQHTDLFDSDIDFAWIKQQLETYAQNQEIFLVFETPKVNGLENDIKNMEFFRNL